MLSFEWDENENRINRKKHGVWFEEAKSVFDDANGRLFADVDHSDGEERFILIGHSSFSKLLVVVHCDRATDSTVRIISARKATKLERAFYEKGI